MNVELLRPFGARVTELSPAELDRGEVARIRGLLAWRGVLHFPEQPIDDDEFVAFLRHFGELMFTAGETPVTGQPDLNVVSNVGRTTPPRSRFHVDTSYVARPPAYTALRAVALPEHGGETLFTDQYRAYETLPFEIRAQLQSSAITHVATGVTVGDDEEVAATHPVFRRHPISDRVALYLSTPARCAAISGLGEPEASDMITFLYEHSIRPEHLLAHRWMPGDVLMWDNGCVLHRADHSAVSGDRVLHRGLVAGYGSAG
jgi:taurine dioxygenase